MVDVSVLVLTLDEARTLKGCLDSIPWKDDVHVLDSGSVDGTVQIARDAGATVHHHEFSSYCDQRNVGLALPFKHPWILMLDADERLTPELTQEIADAVAGAAHDVSMFQMRRKDIFLDRWIKGSSGYPTWFARIFRVGKVHAIKDFNEEFVAEGQTVALREHLIHKPFEKGVDWWIERHNRYSALQARAMNEEAAPDLSTLWSIFHTDPAVRRNALKQLSYRFPARPFAIFIYLYIFKLGFLEGQAGLTFCLLRMSYEAMIDAKLAEARSRTASTGGM